MLQAWSLGVTFALKMWPHLVKAGLLSRTYHPSTRCLLQAGPVQSGRGHAPPFRYSVPATGRRLQILQVPLGGTTTDVREDAVLGEMLSHYKGEAIGRTLVSSTGSRTSSRVLQVLLTTILPGKWRNTNLVNLASLISNNGIFALLWTVKVHTVIFRVLRNLQNQFPPPSFQSSLSPPTIPGECTSQICVYCPRRLTSEHLS